ncbi:MAG: UDP-glucose--sterol glucosyltransferase [Ponticaulis sp.]|nr:UDP-glucose--sterol glucosyltransferase [Ponticaulis sp.]
MKILILTYGTRGDVQPFLALGVALKNRGDDVSLCTSTRFEPFVTDHGLNFCPVPDDLLAVLDTREGRDMLENTHSILDAIRNNLRFARRIGPMLRDQLEAGWRAGQETKPDLVIFHPKGAAGPLVAEAFGVPAVVGLPFPMMVPTGDVPHIGFPNLPFGRRYNRATYWLVNSMAALALKGPLKKLRAKYDLPKAKVYDSLHLADGTQLPSMTAVSPHVVPEPNDWGPNHCMTGYWFLDHEADWTPSEVLQSFLQAGPPPVYIGFGSMAGKKPEQLAEIAVSALQKSGQRGLIATGWGGLKPSDLPETILQIDHAPHDWLFPQMACVVHHGGAGTTAAGLRAGVPSVITPFMGDQPYWADRVATLGVGPKGIPQKKLTTENLAEAIEHAVGSDAIKSAAAALGERIRSESGLATALGFIENVMRVS